MKEIFGFFYNWRCDVFMAMLGAAMLLLFCDAGTLSAMLFMKALGVAVGYAAFRLYRKWDAQGLMDELHDNDDEG